MGNVKLTDIRKEYSDVVAVDGLDIEINDGEFITLVGPSGCGKSTTLGMVAGLVEPTGGTVEISGRDVTTFPPKDRQIAMVFQNIALFPHMDVYDNISFGLRLRDYPKDEIDDRVKEATEILQIERMLDRMPDELSGGQKQRVAIGRAIVREPEVFLMDEPLANLDAKLRVHMRTEIQRIHKNLGTTILYVTHDQEEAMTMSDRIAIMYDGKLQQLAPPLTCYNEPANKFVAGFIGSPSMNFVEGNIRGRTFTAEAFSVELDFGESDPVSDGGLTLGIRPEDIYRTPTNLEHPSQTITVRTEVIEPVGKEIFVYLDMVEEESDDQLLMSVSPDVDIEEDEELEVVFDRKQIHLFDPTTGEAISHGVVGKDRVVSAE